jgi:integrase
MNTDRLAAWLTGVDYRPSTVDLTVREARQIVRGTQRAEQLPSRLRPSAKRILVWLDEDPEAWAADDVRFNLEVLSQPPERPAGLGAARRAAKRENRRKRQQVARSFGDEEWRRLYQALRADDSIEGAVLLVLAETSLRVGDVLRLTRPRLTRGLDTGVITLEVKGGDDRLLHVAGAPESWARLGTVWRGCPGVTVAGLVTEGSSEDPTSRGAAYKRVARKLAAIGEATGATGRLNLHRLRRTVGVQALRAGGNLVAVQQLLGHKSIKTTEGYVDEARPQDVADLQRRVRETFT